MKEGGSSSPRRAPLDRSAGPTTPRPRPRPRSSSSSSPLASASPFVFVALILLLGAAAPTDSFAPEAPRTAAAAARRGGPPPAFLPSAVDVESFVSARRPAGTATATAAATALAMGAAPPSGIYAEASPDVSLASPPAASLASSHYDYLVVVASEDVGFGQAEQVEFVLSLHPISDENLAGCVGASAVRALRGAAEGEEEALAGRAAYTLRCEVNVQEEGGGGGGAGAAPGGGTAYVGVTAECDEQINGANEDALLGVLGRVLVQWAAARTFETTTTEEEGPPPTQAKPPAMQVSISFSDGSYYNLPLDELLGDDPSALFEPGEGAVNNAGGSGGGGAAAAKKPVEIGEMVEMVDATGSRLGAVPRSMVHKYNILHRGAGVVVSRDAHVRRISEDRGEGSTPTPPDVLCHRRTSAKRIFPSLRDMFVGGISAAGERPALTAAREVAEEYGLRRALSYLEGKSEEGGGEDVLSEPLFRCTVCTSYNRCVVTVFTYLYDTSKEEARWQEEEVQWGDFVPYPIVERAARMDIDRLKEEGEWPGTGYRETPPLTGEEEGEAMAARYGDGEEWRGWRFVPDGLLVWEAWEAWREGR